MLNEALGIIRSAQFINKYVVLLIMKESYSWPLITLVATRPTMDYLLNTSLPSIKSQDKQPDTLIIVADRTPLNTQEQKIVTEYIAPVAVTFLHNSHSPGAAGGWNTGLDYIKNHYDDAYIAILDDDDFWFPNHLMTCSNLATQNLPDIVISGLQVVRNGQILETMIPQKVQAKDFLVKNPGWQGSNTFVRLSAIMSIGGYTDGLVSCNDRDLAIRMLSQRNVKVVFTKEVTVTWHCNQASHALSAPSSPQKLKGSAQFWKLHGHRMTPVEKKAFFERMQKLFNLKKEEILGDFH